MRARPKRGAALAGAVALAGLAVACSTVPERVALGVALQETDHAAVQLAVDEINAEGGIRGLPLELVGLDWKTSGDSDPRVTLEWAERLAQDPELLAVVGHSDSASTLTAAALYGRRRIPHLVTIATHPEITRIGSYSYRICPSDSRQAEVLARYAVEDWGKRRIAVFYVYDDYGKGLAELFEQRATELGAQILSSVFHRNFLVDEDRQLITSVLERLRREGPPDLFVLIQRINAAQFTIEKIRELGFASAILGADNVRLLADQAGLRHLASGVRVSTFWVADSDDPRTARFAQAIESRTGRRPDYSQAYAYDAVFLFRDAVLHGGFDREGVKRHLDRLSGSGTALAGVAGTYALSADRDAERDLYVIELEPGGYRVLRRFPAERPLPALAGGRGMSREREEPSNGS